MELKLNLERIAESLRRQMSANRFSIVSKRGVIEIYSRRYKGNKEINEMVVSVYPYRKEVEFHHPQHRIFRRSFEEEAGLGPLVYFLVERGYTTNIENVNKARLKGTEWKKRKKRKKREGDEIMPSDDRFFKSRN